MTNKIMKLTKARGNESDDIIEVSALQFPVVFSYMKRERERGGNVWESILCVTLSMPATCLVRLLTKNWTYVAK